MITLFVVALSTQIACWLVLSVGWQRVRQAQPEAAYDGASQLPVTVVVAARNEEARIPMLLDALEHQSLESFEVIIANDGSTDATAELIRERAAYWRKGELRVLTIEDGEAKAAGLPRKKYALSRAIAEASNNRLVFTDADCEPRPEWLATVVQHALVNGVDSGDVLVGYGPYAPEKGVLNAFVRYETTSTALQTIAAIGWKRPFMAVGRNFSYTKDLFDKIGGFAHSAASLSGDDDLLVQEVRKQNAAEVRYVLDEASFVSSPAPGSFSQWLRQKLRHTSAGKHYGLGIQSGLVVFHLSNLLVWLGVPVLKLTTGTWYGLGFLAIRFLVQRGVLRSPMRVLGTEDLSLTQPLLDLLYLGYSTIVAPIGGLTKPKKW